MRQTWYNRLANSQQLWVRGMTKIKAESKLMPTVILLTNRKNISRSTRHNMFYQHQIDKNIK